LETGLSGLAIELARTMEAIRNSPAAGTPDLHSRIVASDSTEAVALLRRLKQLLADDDGAALDHLLEAREHLDGFLSDADLNTLERDVRDFEFIAALDCLAGIAQRHKFPLE
jgi:two-component system sensor histidine kinase/response regulator